MSNFTEKDKDELESIKHFYDEVYYKNKKTSTHPARHLVGLAEKLHISPGMQILDVACGSGEWLKVCAGFGAHTSGIDISEKAIALCKKQLPTGVFFAQPAEILPFENHHFDVVTCLGSLEHFVKPLESIQEMVRVSKKDAQFILLVPNADFLTRKLGLYKGTNQTDAKEVVRTLEEWRNLFESAGLQIEERWKDLHVLSWEWISIGRWYHVPVRIVQALLLAIWPLQWQYQVYHRCTIRKNLVN